MTTAVAPSLSISPRVQLTARQRACLEQIARRQTSPQRLVRRAKILLALETGGSCTSTLRINITGSLVDRHRSKKTWKKGLSWHPSGSLTRGDTLEAGRADACRLLRLPPRAASHPSACSHPRWLGPRRHPIQ